MGDGDNVRWGDHRAPLGERDGVIRQGRPVGGPRRSRLGSWFPPQMVGGLVALIESAGGAVTSIRGKQRGDRWAPFMEVDLGRLIGSGLLRKPTILTIERKKEWL